MTFQKMISSVTVSSLDILHHVISKSVYVARCSTSNKVKQSWLVAGNSLYLGIDKQHFKGILHDQFV